MCGILYAYVGRIKIRLKPQKKEIEPLAQLCIYAMKAISHEKKEEEHIAKQVIGGRGGCARKQGEK